MDTRSLVAAESFIVDTVVPQVVLLPLKGDCVDHAAHCCGKEGEVRLRDVPGLMPRNAGRGCARPGASHKRAVDTWRCSHGGTAPTRRLVRRPMTTRTIHRGMGPALLRTDCPRTNTAPILTITATGLARTITSMAPIMVMVRMASPERSLRRATSSSTATSRCT